MEHLLDITVNNKLLKEQRDIHVYHNARHSSHIISYGSSLSLRLQEAGHGDFLHIAVVKGPGDLWEDCLITLPQGVNFEFFSRGDLTLSNANIKFPPYPGPHAGIISAGTGRLILKIPPGPPSWELKLIWLPPGPEKIGDTDVNISDQQPYSSSFHQML